MEGLSYCSSVPKGYSTKDMMNILDADLKNLTSQNNKNGFCLHIPMGKLPVTPDYGDGVLTHVPSICFEKGGIDAFVSDIFNQEGKALLIDKCGT